MNLILTNLLLFSQSLMNWGEMSGVIATVIAILAFIYSVSQNNSTTLLKAAIENTKQTKDIDFLKVEVAALKVVTSPEVIVSKKELEKVETGVTKEMKKIELISIEIRDALSGIKESFHQSALKSLENEKNLEVVRAEVNEMKKVISSVPDKQTIERLIENIKDIKV